MKLEGKALSLAPKSPSLFNRACYESEIYKRKSHKYFSNKKKVLKMEKFRGWNFIKFRFDLKKIHNIEIRVKFYFAKNKIS